MGERGGGGLQSEDRGRKGVENFPRKAPPPSPTASTAAAGQPSTTLPRSLEPGVPPANPLLRPGIHGRGISVFRRGSIHHSPPLSQKIQGTEGTDEHLRAPCVKGLFKGVFLPK